MQFCVIRFSGDYKPRNYGSMFRSMSLYTTCIFQRVVQLMLRLSSLSPQLIVTYKNTSEIFESYIFTYFGLWCNKMQKTSFYESCKHQIQAKKWTIRFKKNGDPQAELELQLAPHSSKTQSTINCPIDCFNAHFSTTPMSWRFCSLSTALKYSFIWLVNSGFWAICGKSENGTQAHSRLVHFQGTVKVLFEFADYHGFYRSRDIHKGTSLSNS